MGVPKDATARDKGTQGKPRIRRNLKPPRLDVVRHHGLNRAHNGCSKAKRWDDEALVAYDTNLHSGLSFESDRRAGCKMKKTFSRARWESSTVCRKQDYA